MKFAGIDFNLLNTCIKICTKASHVLKRPYRLLPKSNIYSLLTYISFQIIRVALGHITLCSILEIDCTHCWFMWLNWWVVIVKMRNIFVRGIMCAANSYFVRQNSFAIISSTVICGKSKMRSEGKWASKLNLSKRCFMLPHISLIDCLSQRLKKAWYHVQKSD